MSSYDPAALECLAAIIEEGGFERAAQRLNVTQSAVSQRLRALEAQVGSVLIVRSRPLRPTTAGQLLLKHTKQMRLLRADLERDLQELAPSAPGGGREDERISIAINADSIATWALGALQRPGAPAPAAGNHRGRPGLHPGMAALWPGAGLRHHAQAGAARLQDGAAGRHALCGRGLSLRLCKSTCPVASRRTTSARCRTSRSTARTTWRSSSCPAPSGSSGWRCNQLFVPSSEGQMRAVAGRVGRGVCCQNCWCASTLADGSLVDMAPGQVAPHSVVLALLEPRIRGARRSDPGPDGNGRAIAGCLVRVNTP